MIKKILKVVTVILAFLILVSVGSVVSLRLYYLHTVRQTPGKLSVLVQSGALGSNVNVFSGSGGWFYVCAHNGPAAMTPFGMVRLGPDTACMLLDKNFAARARDAVKQDQLSLPEIELLKYGRHFRLDSGAKVVVGRNESENKRLEALAREDDVLCKPVEVMGPVAILRSQKRSFYA